MSCSDKAILIGLDWGTTSLRAYLIATHGKVLDTISTADGILSIDGRDFAKTFTKVVGPWLDEFPDLPVVASGMITSRNGWLETPYLPVPAGACEFATALTCFEVHDTQKIYFVTGASYETEGRAPDIMRGEETQIIGCIQERQCPESACEIYLLPGTHSKWAIAHSGKIHSFMSFMTGELFDILENHSILGTLMRPAKSSLSDGFLRGVNARLESNLSLLHQLFSVRTLPLFDQLPNEEISNFLSGLLIGDEVNSAKKHFDIDKSKAVQIIGRGDLATRYSLALDAANISSMIASEHSAATGLFQIAKKAKII